MSTGKSIPAKDEDGARLQPKILGGEDAADFLSKLEALEIGGALSLPSVMPGLTSKRVTAVLRNWVEDTSKKQWNFDMYWCDTFIGTASAINDGLTVELR